MKKRSKSFKDPDPLFVIELFMEYRQNGVIPPDKVLDWLAMRFENYLCGKGQKTLDESFGLSPKSFKKEMFFVRDRELCLEMFLLQKWFRLSAEDAAGVLEAKAEMFKGWDRLGLKGNRKVGSPKGDRLLSTYLRKWKKLFTQCSQEALAPILKADVKDKIDFIGTFPKAAVKDYILPKLLKFYPDLAKKISS